MLVPLRTNTMHATRDNLGFLWAKALQRWNDLLAAGFRRAGFGEVRPAYGSVLLPLFEADGLRVGELAARSRLSKQAMTTLVRTLEARGLIRRRPDPDDGRAARVYLTPRARRLQATAEHVLATLDRRVPQRLPPAPPPPVLDSLLNPLAPRDAPPPRPPC